MSPEWTKYTPGASSGIKPEAYDAIVTKKYEDGAYSLVVFGMGEGATLVHVCAPEKETPRPKPLRRKRIPKTVSPGDS